MYKNTHLANDRSSALELLRRMELYSEQTYCAGWLIDLEYHLWENRTDHPEIEELALRANGWWKWNAEADGNREFVPLSVWSDTPVLRYYGIQVNTYLQDVDTDPIASDLLIVATRVGQFGLGDYAELRERFSDSFDTEHGTTHRLASFVNPIWSTQNLHRLQALGLKTIDISEE